MGIFWWVGWSAVAFLFIVVGWVEQSETQPTNFAYAFNSITTVVVVEDDNYLFATEIQNLQYRLLSEMTRVNIHLKPLSIQSIEK
ncbi:MAG: hypothetical protein AAFS12_08180 [Cyanobacteria bacterium J06632_19]